MKLLTKDMLFQIFPSAVRSKLDMDSLVINLQVALNELIGDKDFGNEVTYRQASFLAQTGHESGSFTAVRENMNYSAKGLKITFGKYFLTDELANAYARQPEKIANRVYANRMGNGNEQSGDGWRFRGRGLIQLTGRNNYVKCGNDLGIDLLKDPSWLETPAGAVRSAMWFWNTNSLNTFADVEDIRGMTKRINGGYNGLDDRLQKYEKAKQVLSTGV